MQLFIRWAHGLHIRIFEYSLGTLVEMRYVMWRSLGTRAHACPTLNFRSGGHLTLLLIGYPASRHTWAWFPSPHKVRLFEAHTNS